MIDHCISLFKKRQQELLYKVYITDALKAISENTSRKDGGVCMQKRYADMINEFYEKAPAEEKTAEGVIEKIRSKLKGE